MKLQISVKDIMAILLKNVLPGATGPLLPSRVADINMLKQLDETTQTMPSRHNPLVGPRVAGKPVVAIGPVRPSPPLQPLPPSGL